MHEVDGLVYVETDAVAGAMREPGKFVTGAVTPFLVLRANRIVHSASRHADASGLDRDLLAVAHLLPDSALLRLRLTEHEGSRDIRLVAFDRTAAVHEHDLALA